MIHFPKPAITKQPKIRQGTIPFMGFPGGLRTDIPPGAISTIEMSECVDFRIRRGGTLVSRDPITKYTDTEIGSIVACKTVYIGSTQYHLLADDDNKIYYLDDLTPTLIGPAVEGEPYIIPFNSVAVVCDGSYLKYIDSTSEVKIAYDDGSGTQFDNYAGLDQEGIKIGDGTNTKAGVAFTTSDWDSGYTIPPTTIYAKLKRTGTLAGVITCKILSSDGSTTLASKAFTETAGEIADVGGFYEISFSSVDITTELSPNTVYICSIEYATGDSSNYLELRCTTEYGSGKIYSGSWTDDTSINPIMKIMPGIPPKATFGCVSDSRLFLGGDPDNPGYIWCSNYTHLDFSSLGGGGYIGVIDEGRNSFPVGGIADLYGDLYVFGTEDHPYISKLQGSSFSDYELVLMFQRVWTTHKTLVNTGNDLWVGSGDGINNLTGVQSYGDLRAFSASDPVRDRIEEYWSTSASFAAYYPVDGQYWLCMPDHSKILVGHTKLGQSDSDSETAFTQFPWTEYDLPVTPTCLGMMDGMMCIGADDGYLYRIDTTGEYKDLGTDQIYPSFRTAYIDLPFASVDFIQAQFMGASTGGSQIVIEFFKNWNHADASFSKTLTIAMSDALTIDDLTMDIDDLIGAIDPEMMPLYFNMNLNARSIQVRCKDIHIAGYPVFVNGFILKYRSLEK